MTVTEVDYQLVDFDQHYYETEDCFTRHMPQVEQHLAIRVKRQEGMPAMLVAGDRPLMFSTFPDESTPPPGALTGLAQSDAGQEGSNEDGKAAWQAAEMPKIGPEGMAPFQAYSARVPLLDQQGIEAAMMFPTAVLGIEHDVAGTPELLYANLTAFNRWVEEQWGFAGRTIAAPWLSLVDTPRAVAEVERLIAAGARSVMLKPGPSGGRSPADPVNDPVWSRIAEANLLVVMHGGNAGYQDGLGALWGEQTGMPGFRLPPFIMATAFVERAIADTLAAFILHNLFARFPSLKVCSVENGSTWVRELMGRMDRAWHIARRNPGLGGVVAERPSETFRRHIWVNPYPLEDIGGLVESVGIERVLFGSDFPHPTAASDPREYLRGLKGLDDRQTRAIMRDNGAALLELS